MIVTSTALIKSRIPNVQRIINGLMKGSLKPDKIYFFISEDPYMIDEGIKPEEIPIINNSRVEFVYTKNIGSLRKIIPILKMYWTRNNTQIIVCDDDRAIPPDLVKKLIDYQQDIKHRFHACASAGNIFKKGTRSREIILGWDHARVKKPVQVDLLNSGMQMLVKPKFFPKDDILNWEQYIEELGVNQSEENFLSYLLAKKGTKRFVVPISSCPMQLPVKGELFHSKDVQTFKRKQSSGKYLAKMIEWRT
jgi:hypothetical protein